ncbi:hypothetical protein [Paraburkholderia sp. J41]|uniref:hypothetical protein n=1 Tax=Paraburkholderia sp. J41 TaxID=2805433 RepID=UPI002AC34FB5|nr:hypothetical protein [Paraburkholderia sp. J41]
MWIATQRSVLIVVAARDQFDHLVVSARSASDLESVFGEGLEIETDRTQSWPFAVTLRSAAVRSALDVALMEIDYHHYPAPKFG